MSVNNEKNLAEKKDEIKIGDITVELIYAKNNKTIQDCLQNIVKQKIGEQSWQEENQNIN